MANPNGRPKSGTVKLTKAARERFDRQLAEKLPDIFTALFEAGTKDKDTQALSLLVQRAVPLRKGVPINFTTRPLSGAAAGLRQQISELRRLVAVATAVRSSDEAHHDDGSVEWAEQVSGLTLDRWQRDVLLSDDARVAILCCRQSGKSTVVALKAADLVRRGGMAVVVAPSLRQSSLLFRKLNRLLVTGGEMFRRETQTELETTRGGLALCLPGDRPDMLRGLSLRWPQTSLLIVDEAARVRETMWATISPMLAAAPLAHQALLSTPAGASGEFHRVMTSDESDWRRITVTAEHCLRISAAFLGRERVRLGDALFKQEYECAFIAAPGSVFAADVLAAMFDGCPAMDEGPHEAAAGGRSRFVF